MAHMAISDVERIGLLIEHEVEQIAEWCCLYSKKTDIKYILSQDPIRDIGE